MVKTMAHAYPCAASSYFALEKLEEASKRLCNQKFHQNDNQSQRQDTEANSNLSEDISPEELEVYGDFTALDVLKAHRHVEKEGDRVMSCRIDAFAHGIPLTINFTVERVQPTGRREQVTITQLQIEAPPDIKAPLAPFLTSCENQCDVDGGVQLLVNYCQLLSSREDVFKRLLEQLGENYIQLPQPGVLLFRCETGPSYGISWDIVVSNNSDVHSSVQLVIKSAQIWSKMDEDDVLGDLPEAFTNMVALLGAPVAVASVVRTVCQPDTEALT